MSDYPIDTEFIALMWNSLFPYRSIVQTTKIQVNSFTRWVIENSLDTLKETGKYLILCQPDTPILITRNEYRLIIVHDPSLKNMEIKIIGNV